MFIDLDQVASRADLLPIKQEINGLRQEMKTSAAETRYEILKWVLPLILGLYGLIIFKLF